MFNNTFRGPIPDAFGNLKDLIALYLDENELTGQIPTSLGQMTSIIDLRCVICYFCDAARVFVYCPFTSSPVFVALTHQAPSQQIVRDDTHGTLRPESIGGRSIQNEASFVHYAPNKSNRSNSIRSAILKSLP